MKLMDHTRLWFLTLPYFVAGIEHEEIFLGVCSEHLQGIQKKIYLEIDWLV